MIIIGRTNETFKKLKLVFLRFVVDKSQNITYIEYAVSDVN